MNSNKKDIIIFLSVGKVYTSDGNRILEFNLPEASVKYWDVLNKETLQDNINTFISVNKLEPSPITFVLSESACFSKDIKESDLAKAEEEKNKFLEAVPFNYLISKAYKIPEGERVIAANKDLIDAIAEVFEEKGFPLFAIIPATIFPNDGTKSELDMQFVKAINDSHELVLTGNMISSKALAPEVPAVQAPVITTNKASSGYLPYLIGVGLLAVVALGILIFLRR